MGGTSTDVSLDPGRPADDLAADLTIGYYPIKVPSVDVHSVGAGGGSIAARADDRRAARRSGKRRRGAGPGLLRQGRGAADGHRCQRGARPPAAETSRRQDGPRHQGCRGSGSENRAASLSLDLAPGGAEASSTSSTRTCSARCALVTVQKGLDPQGFCAGTVSAAPVRSTATRWRCSPAAIR